MCKTPTRSPPKGAAAGLPPLRLNELAERDRRRELLVRERRARLDDARRVSSTLEHASDLPAAVAGLSVDDAVERLRRGSAPMVG